METYISEAACRGLRPAVAQDVTMETRRFLVGKLLSARTDPRLIAAPTGFGKSLLATQYASLVFSFWHVFWLDCQDLRFLRALNDQSLPQLIFQRDEEAALVVFDDVPLLSPDQAKSFWHCAQQLQEKGCEVLVCATPVCAASFAQAGPWKTPLNHKSLMVQCSEQDLLGEAPCAVSDDPFLVRIPALAWGGTEGAGTLVRGFVFDELPVEDVLAGLFLMCTGTLDGAQAAQLPLNAKERIEALRHPYPYFRFREDENIYTTVTCDDELFRRVLLPLSTEMLSFLDEDDAAVWAQALVDALLSAGQGTRACHAARALMTHGARTAWLEAQSLTLALSFCSEAFKAAVESIRRQYPRDEEGLMATVLLAQAAEGASLNRRNAWAEASRQDLSLKARCIHAVLALRATQNLEITRKPRMLLNQLRKEVQESDCAESWQARLFCFVNDMTVDYSKALSSLAERGGKPTDGQDQLIHALCALWLAEDAPLLSNARGRKHLVTLVVQLKTWPLPAGVLVGLGRAQRLLTTGHISQTPSTWDYHAVSVPHLRLTLWGSFSATMGTRVFDARSFRRKKAMTLLALLATEIGCDFNRDYLVETLWPGSSLARARRNFYAVWADLRQTLCLEDGSCPYLVRSGLSYRLEESLVECDMQELDQLCVCLRDRTAPLSQWDQALTELSLRFAGEVLPGGPTNERLDLYWDVSRVGILDALMAAGQTLYERGEDIAALRYARAVLARAPHREDAYELAMKSQIRLGQRTSALSTFITCQHFLSDELGVDPSPTVCALYEEALGAAC